MAKPQNAEQYFEVFRVHCERKGMHFNPNIEITWSLGEGLWTNKNRYGYPSCPCRLACEELEKDRDIICPCEYAPADIAEFGQCYCGLFVNQKYLEGKMELRLTPERRPFEKMG